MADEGTFQEAADKALAALGADPARDAIDGWADPIGAARALGAEGESFVLRGALELPDAVGELGPAPVAPGWIRVTRGSAEIRMSMSMSPATCETRKVARVVLESGPLPDGAEGARAWVSLAVAATGGAQRPTLPEAGSKLLVAEAWARTEETALGRLRGLAGKLARAMSVPASLPGSAAGEENEEAAEGAAPRASARAVARFSLRTEGPRLVLRDFASRGPREGVWAYLALSVVLAVVSGWTWLLFSRTTSAMGFANPMSIAWLGMSLLLTLATVAFLGVARHALKSKAQSAPLVAIGAGKVTVAPWVGRDGAIMTAPEGQFGAGIDFADVRGVSAQARQRRHAVEVATDHGPIDALLIDDPAIAEYLAAALSRAIDDMRPAGAGPTASKSALASEKAAQALPLVRIS